MSSAKSGGGDTKRFAVSFVAAEGSSETGAPCKPMRLDTQSDVLCVGAKD